MSLCQLTSINNRLSSKIILHYFYLLRQFPSLHRIYLSLYTAICFELMAQPLPIGSPQKLSFFRLALDHYHKAENYMFVAQCEYTTASVEFMNRTSPKRHRQFSSSSSDSSQLSSRSSTFSAPDIGLAHGSQFSILSAASSLCSDCSKPEDESYNPLKPPPLRIKKKVSFSSS